MAKFADAMVEMGFAKINDTWEIRFPNNYSVRILFDGGKWAIWRFRNGDSGPWYSEGYLDEQNDLGWLLTGIRQEVESTRNRDFAEEE